MSGVVQEQRQKFFDTSGFKPCPKYKESGVEWLGEIPEHWDIVKLKYSLNEIIGGGTPDTNNMEYWDNENGIPWVSISDITNSTNFTLTDTYSKISNKGLLSKNLKVVPKGTLLISIFASLGKSVLLGTDAAVNQAILALVPSNRLSKDFLRYYLQDAERYIDYYSSSNTQENLNLSKIKNLKILSPSIKEQQTIANFLDRETHKIDKLIEKKQRLVELLEEKRSALISHTVTKGLDPDTPMKDSGVEWLNEIPEHWDVVKLRMVTKSHKQGYYSKKEYTKKGVKLVRITDIDNLTNIDYSKCPYLDISEKDRLDHILKIGDFVFARSGSIGRFGVVKKNENAIFASYLIRFRFFNHLNTDFLKFYFLSEFFQQSLLADLHGGANQNIHAENIKNQIILLPPYQEQKQIAEYLNQKTSKIDTLIDKINQQIEYLKEYRTALISAAVTGKIDVRGEEQK